MPAKAVAKKKDTSASKGGAQAKQGNQAKPNTAQPQAKKEEAPKKDPPKKDPPKKVAVATAPENKAHHATLTGTKCNDCAVGLLKQHTSESLRNQKKIDPGNQKYHLQDTEEIDFVRTNPLTLQIVGLRRERSLSNRFDDLLVALYDPALLKEGEKTVLEAEGLRKENLASTQAFVNAILGAKAPAPPPPKDWPLPGADVSCKQCKHWRVLIFPITTEPGYDNDKPSLKDAQGHTLPDFNNLTLLPDAIGAIAPGIYNGSYRVGLHLGTRKPPNSFAALQLVFDSIPSRRRYPITDYLERAQAAYDNGKDDDLLKAFIKKDAQAQKDARARIEAELGKTMSKKTPAEKAAFDKAVQAKLDAENLETYKPKIAEYRKNAATKVLSAFAATVNKQRSIRLENASGAETQNFETAGNEVSGMQVADDGKSPMKVCLQFAFKAPSLLAPKTLTLTKDDILVTFATDAGTNIHRSQPVEALAWHRDREVNNWSEGCQVFRSPNDFHDFMRMAMLSKRALCPSRKASCGEKLTQEDVTKAIGARMTEYLGTCPKEFASKANVSLRAAFAPPSPPPKAAAPDPKVRAAVEKLVDASKAYKALDTKLRTAFREVFPKSYEDADTFKVMKTHVREKVLAGLNDKSGEEDITQAIDASLQDFSKKLTETKTAWLKDLNEDQLKQKYQQYLAEGLEPCDFGECGFKFDYMLAETSRANMEAFVSKLGDRSWNDLFPEDAPPPPPKQPKATPPPSKKATPTQNKPAVASAKPTPK